MSLHARTCIEPSASFLPTRSTPVLISPLDLSSFFLLLSIALQAEPKVMPTQAYNPSGGHDIDADFANMDPSKLDPSTVS